MPTPAVSIRALTKQYGSLRAVNNLNLDVAPGEILGFLGLNGAGKTTTIRILLDLLRPTSGHAFIFGRDCRSRFNPGTHQAVRQTQSRKQSAPGPRSRRNPRLSRTQRRR